MLVLRETSFLSLVHEFRTLREQGNKVSEWELKDLYFCRVCTSFKPSACKIRLIWLRA
jgi:hypothetical protein